MKRRVFEVLTATRRAAPIGGLSRVNGGWRSAAEPNRIFPNQLVRSVTDKGLLFPWGGGSEIGEHRNLTPEGHAALDKRFEELRHGKG